MKCKSVKIGTMTQSLKSFIVLSLSDLPDDVNEMLQLVDLW